MGKYHCLIWSGSVIAFHTSFIGASRTPFKHDRLIGQELRKARERLLRALDRAVFPYQLLAILHVSKTIRPVSRVLLASTASKVHVATPGPPFLPPPFRRSRNLLRPDDTFMQTAQSVPRL
jgi:hypothetical protein